MITPAIIEATLIQLGCTPSQADQAINHPRIAWTEDALAACVAYVKASTAAKPAAVLWSQFLKTGRTPPLLKVATPPASDVPTCPACGGPIDQCCGLHGWAAAYRHLPEVQAAWRDAAAAAAAEQEEST